MVTGKGYLLFIDKVNRNVPQMYKDKGMKMALIDKTYFKGNRFIPNLNEAEPNNRLQEDLMI